MKNKILPIATFLLCGATLIGCAESTPGQDRSFIFAPESVSTLINSANMFTGDSVNLGTFIYPVKAQNAPLVYESTEPSVATVSSSGVITAKAPGSARICIYYVTKDGNSLLKDIPVSVSDKIGVSKTLDNAVSSMLSKQQKKYPKGMPDKVRCYETREISTRVDGVLTNIRYEDTVLTLCVSEAFFGIVEVDREMKMPNGDFTVTPFNWTFFTNNEYDAYLYHISEQGKTRLFVPAQSYQSKPTVEVTYHLLDSIFSSGRAIMTSRLEDALNSHFLNGYSNWKKNVKAGGVGTDSVTFSLAEKYRNEVADYDDEKYNNIPYKTLYDIDFSETTLWVGNGEVKTSDINQIYKYNYNGKSYELGLKIQYTFEFGDAVTIDYPIDSEYRPVKDLFEL